jgi:hypothetical protein
MKRLSKVLVLILSIAASIYALLPHFVTLATNDPTDYQPLIITSVKFTSISIGGAILYVYLERGWFRYASLIPLGVSAFVIYAIIRFWPYAFP